jgi:predicted glycosyltransferase
MVTQTPDRPQRRAIFFVFDGGTGIGHLRRLACIAKKLQGPFSCLIVTGHRAAANWFVPEECEYIHLPSWDSLLQTKAQYYGRTPFILLDQKDAVQLRKDILTGVVESFQPDVIFVDHLPLGAHQELADIIESTNCLKYLVTRGVLNETENLRQLILGGKANNYLKSYYHRILVASDPKVFNFCRQYNIAAEIRQKTVHTGYVIENIPQDMIQETRKDRGVENGDIWVVASAGSGQLGESLIRNCIELARAHKNVIFDIVVGPRSKLPWESRNKTTIVRDNLQLHKESAHMPCLHASADIVISTAGYNSLLETLQGNAKILCFPYRTDRRDEQYQHAASLKTFVDIEVSVELSELPSLFERAIRSIPDHQADRRRELDFNGTAVIERIALDDLGVAGALRSGRADQDVGRAGISDNPVIESTIVSKG